MASAAKQVRWGIMGTGNIARQFVTGIAASQKNTLAAVGSRNKTSAVELIEQYRQAASQESSKTFGSDFYTLPPAVFFEKYYVTSPAPSAYGSYDELLADPTCDVIYISLPNNLHYEWTLRALRAGRHVLCEKPLAVTTSEAEEMFAVAKSCERTLVEAFMYKAHPLTHKVKTLINDGAIGRVKLIRTSFCYRTRRTENNIRFDKSLAGGALMDIGCYCVSFSRMIAGGEPTSVHAVGHVNDRGIDEQCSGLLKFANDITAEFTAAMTTQADNTAYICGDAGYLKIRMPWKPGPGDNEVIVAHSVPPRQDNPQAPPVITPDEVHTVSDPRNIYCIEADAVADVLQSGVEPFVTPADTINNLRCIEELRRQVYA